MSTLYYQLQSKNLFNDFKYTGSAPSQQTFTIEKTFPRHQSIIKRQSLFYEDVITWELSDDVECGNSDSKLL